jgi:SAM-dependent methyltransferase
LFINYKALKIYLIIQIITMFTSVLSKYSAVHTHLGTDKIASHSYGDVYNKLFSEYKDTAEKILEIGIDGGFAIKAYSEYFTNAHIYGIDIRDNIGADIKNKENIHLCFGDAKDSRIINAFPFEFDIIIEDASHIPDDQIQHFKDYSKYVKPGGIYIIEDVSEVEFTRVVDNLSTFATNNHFTLEIVDLRSIKNRFDDILLVFKKKC